ncbi:zf-TFIIB domain-containing protein [Myxococcus sp. K15C18031901]|uniref:TFIIB-type zinc ribbon-containing protein n=1 Tax=Myxococcus dinghuensis TaxID=2906761 RepID=UPI0020A788B6|nr:zf-TFIIB domain-containing protein [Myxococcus dinghuensis]MCP3102074.1 zf-TFIIB domain-containing protein [Myxococcus dinghuensis]
MSIQCPICPQPAPTLRVIEMRGVQVDTCERCYGHWLNAGELDRLAPGWKTDALVTAMHTASRRCRHARHHVPTHRTSCGLCGVEAARCPCCGEYLAKVATEVCAVDFCGKCHGLWLDPNELKALMEWHRSAMRPLAMGAAVMAGGAAAGMAAVALADVAARAPGEHSRVADALASVVERAGDATDALELASDAVDLVDVSSMGESLSAAVEAAAEGGAAVGEAMAVVLEAVAGLFH